MAVVKAYAMFALLVVTKTATQNKITTIMKAYLCIIGFLMFSSLSGLQFGISLLDCLKGGASLGFGLCAFIAAAGCLEKKTKKNKDLFGK